MRRRDIEKFKKLKNVKLTELSELAGLRHTTVMYYMNMGLLEWTQEEKRFAKYFDRVKCLKRLKEIEKLKKKRLTIKEILEHFNTKQSEKN